MDYLDRQSFGEEAAQEAAQEAPQDNTEKFEALIKGEYKEAFDSRVQKILDGRLKQLRQENERLRQAEEIREQASLSAIDRLSKEAEEIQKTYPGFDWEKEMRNPVFVRLIHSGVDGRTAYEVVYRRELLAQAVHFGAKTAREQVSRSLSSGGHRVRENGSGSVSILRNDPRSLTASELAAIRTRVQKGEKIRF